MNIIKVRKAENKDKKLIYKWFNLKESINYKIKTKRKISLREHEIWFNKIIQKKCNKLLIIEENRKNIGQIRLELIKKNIFTIDIFVLKEYREKGIASKALKISEQLLKRKSKIISIVKKNNINSLSFFISNDYKVIKNSNICWYLEKII
jgi:GNAT superfamily N-acetyltransferase